MKRKRTAKSSAAGKEHTNPADHPAFGMWADREDMKDVHARLRNIRAPRFDPLGRRRQKP